MNIFEAAHTGKPFSHPEMIGAYKIYGDYWVHRDNVKDFDNMDFIYKHCLGNENLFGLTTQCLLRNDWFVYDEIKTKFVGVAQSG